MGGVRRGLEAGGVGCSSGGAVKGAVGGWTWGGGWEAGAAGGSRGGGWAGSGRRASERSRAAVPCAKLFPERARARSLAELFFMKRGICAEEGRNGAVCNNNSVALVQ